MTKVLSGHCDNCDSNALLYTVGEELYCYACYIREEEY